MSIAEAVLQKLTRLPEKQQKQVLDYIERLQDSEPVQAGSNADPYEWVTIASQMNLEGPQDMSEHLDDYLYRNGGKA